MKSSWIRKLFVVVASLLLVLAGAMAWLVWTFDAEAYKRLAVDWVKVHRDRNLAIHGPVKLSVFPRLSVQLSEVTLSEKGSDTEFAAVNQLSLSVALAPLLRQRLEIDRVGARGLRLVYRRNDRGRSNIDDLLASTERPSGPAEARGSGGQALRFDVQGIRFDDLRLSVRDDQTRVSGEIGLNHFSTGRLADKVESPVELDAQLSLKSPLAQGRLTGRGDLRLDLDGHLVGLRALQLQWKGDVPGARQADAELTGDLAFDWSQGKVNASGIELQAGATVGAFKFSHSQLRLRSFQFEPDQSVFKLEQLAVKLQGTRNGQPLSATLDWPGLSVTGDSLAGSAFSGSVSLQGSDALAADFKSGAPQGSFRQLKLPAIQTALKGHSGSRQLSGQIGADLLLGLNDKTVRLEAIKSRLSLQETASPAWVIDLEGHLQASPDTARWDLSGRLNARPFRSSGQARLADNPVSVRADASFDALDLNRLMPGTPGAAGSAPAAPAGRATAASSAIDLSALGAVQGQFNLRIAEFLYQTHRLTDVGLDAHLDSGVLKVGRFTGHAWGGSFDAGGSVDSRNSRFTARATAQGVNVNALLKDLAQKDVLEGTGRVTLDLTTAGRHVADLKSRLQGSASMQLRDGAIKGVNLARTLRQARAALSTQQDAKQAARQTEKTDFSEMSASFAIRDGIAHNDDLVLKSPFLRVGGDGDIDLPRSRIDYTVRATLAETSKGQDGAELAALKGLTVPVRLSGPLDAIDWTVQWSAVAANVIKSEAGRELKNQLKDRLREKLGEPAAPRNASEAASAPPRPKDVLKDKLLRGLFK